MICTSILPGELRERLEEARSLVCGHCQRVKHKGLPCDLIIFPFLSTPGDYVCEEDSHVLPVSANHTTLYNELKRMLGEVSKQ